MGFLSETALRGERGREDWEAGGGAWRRESEGGDPVPGTIAHRSNLLPLIFHLLNFKWALGNSSISGLVVEYIVAIDVTRARFPADAFLY